MKHRCTAYYTVRHPRTTIPWLDIVVPGKYEMLQCELRRFHDLQSDPNIEVVHHATDQTGAEHFWTTRTPKRMTDVLSGA
jgi:hypothetical protein